MDLVHDQLATRRKLRVLTIIDTFSGFSPAIEPRFNFRGADVVECWKESAERSDSRPRSVSIRVASSCRVTWIYGLTSAMSLSISFGLVNRQTTPSSSHSIASSELNA